jgi:hypothetical protein
MKKTKIQKVIARRPNRVIYCINKLSDPPYKEEVRILDFT